MSKHIIIRSLHRDESFLARGTDHLLEQFTRWKQEYTVRDLYDMQFDPVLTTADFQALKAGNLLTDIATEQKLIKEAEYMWVVFPIWWTSMPAILKGYIDRIFLSGFAYHMEKDAPVGLLTDKKVIILNSMGMSREDYESSGMYKALYLTIDKGIFEFSGMKVIAHKYFTSIMSASTQEQESYFNEIDQLVSDIVASSDTGSDQKIKKKYMTVK